MDGPRRPLNQAEGAPQTGDPTGHNPTPASSRRAHPRPIPRRTSSSTSRPTRTRPTGSNISRALSASRLPARRLPARVQLRHGAPCPELSGLGHSYVDLLLLAYGDSGRGLCQPKWGTGWPWATCPAHRRPRARPRCGPGSPSASGSRHRHRHHRGRHRRRRGQQHHGAVGTILRGGGAWARPRPEGWRSLVDRTGLENRQAARSQGFESLPLRLSAANS